MSKRNLRRRRWVARLPRGLGRVAVAMLLLGALTVCALVLYVGQFADTNAYVGIYALDLSDPFYWLVMVGWLGSLALLLPVRVERPSDIFLSIYCIATALWSASYWPATRMLDGTGAVVLWATVMVPAIAVRSMRLVGGRIRFDDFAAKFRKLPQEQLIPAILGLMLVTTVLAYAAGHGVASFDFDIAVERRLAGREEFSGLTGYLLQMATNGLAPLLAFLAMTRRSRACLALAFGFAIFCFWLQGVKSPVVAVVALAALGNMYQRGRIGAVSLLLIGSLLAIMLISLVELHFSEISLIAEFGIRRVVLVNSTIQAYFVHALVGAGSPAPLLTGIDFQGYPTPEYFVGAIYMGNELTNANTNAFLHELAARGIGAYLLTVGAAALVLRYLDALYLRQRRPEGFAIAAILGLLLVEQAFTIALVSSGVLLCVVLMAVFSRRPRALTGAAALSES